MICSVVFVMENLRHGWQRRLAWVAAACPHKLGGCLLRAGDINTHDKPALTSGCREMLPWQKDVASVGLMVEADAGPAQRGEHSGVSGLG
jgi:hypothetical protein